MKKTKERRTSLQTDKEAEEDEEKKAKKADNEAEAEESKNRKKDKSADLEAAESNDIERQGKGIRQRA